MSTRFYDTDLADAAWSWVAPVLPAARPGGRPRTTDLRAVLNAIFYLMRTGCGQAANGDYCHANFHLGARSTITFRPGKMPVCGFIYTACSTSRPVAMRVERPGPSVVIVDGQSVKTTERGGTRGFDAYKRVKGRKRHILVDTLGLLLANRVEPADTSDRLASALLLGGLRALFPRIRTVIVDVGHQSRKLARSLEHEQGTRMAATDRQEATACVQNHGSDPGSDPGSWNAVLPGWVGTAD